MEKYDINRAYHSLLRYALMLLHLGKLSMAGSVGFMGILRALVFQFNLL